MLNMFYKVFNMFNNNAELLKLCSVKWDVGMTMVCYIEM
jgi:hypothetical protein